MKYVQLLALASVLSLGCGDDDPSDDTNTDDTDTDIPETTITINGTAVDLASQVPAAEGLCAAIIDPTPAVTGGDAITVVETTVGAGGAFTAEKIPTTPPFGMFAQVGDCEGAEATVWTSLTGMLAPQYQNLNDGDSLDVTAFSISLEMLAGIEASLDAVGEDRSAQEAGAMVGWVFDSAGNPIAGATVSCGDDCGPFYYFDQDSADGLFSTAGAANAATDASGMLIMLDPPTANYAAAADGYEFDGFLFGGNPGFATFAAFYAK
jgi:hypothetical protein